MAAAAAANLPLKSESGGRLSVDSPDTAAAAAAKKKSVGRKARLPHDEESLGGDGGMNGGGGSGLEGQPPKKRGKGKGKAAGKEAANGANGGGPKRVFICPHCQVSWSYSIYVIVLQYCTVQYIVYGPTTNRHNLLYKGQMGRALALQFRPY
jgi:hypothetical protein